MTAPDFPEFLTVEEVADSLNIPPKSVYSLIHDGELEARQVRRQYRIPRDAFREYVKRSSFEPDREKLDSKAPVKVGRTQPTRKGTAPANAKDATQDQHPATMAERAAHVAGAIRSSIENGLYRYGDKLPGYLDLENTYAEHKEVIKLAVRNLKDSGHIETRNGQGTFVVWSQVPEQSDQERRTSAKMSGNATGG